MEEAFSWDLMSYNFFPYFWGDEARWHELIKETSSADSLFQAFLQSGMARVVVPMRLGYEAAVTHLLNTGNLWRGIRGVVTGQFEAFNFLYLPEEGKEEAKWKSRVPTALTILQSDSNPLKENGLPCWCEGGTPIAENEKPDKNPNPNLLGEPSSAEPGAGEGGERNRGTPVDSGIRYAGPFPPPLDTPPRTHPRRA